MTAAAWIEQKTVKNKQLVDVLRRDLDHGEAESIALALELKADFILLDEKDGRHAAQRLGLRVVGVLGVLLEAKKKGHIGKIGPHLDALRNMAGFYISDAVYLNALNLAGE